MASRIRLKVNHRRPKPPTAREHDDAYRRIGATDGLKPVLRGDKERVRPKKRKPRK